MPYVLSPALLRIVSDRVGWERMPDQRQKDLCQSVSDLSRMFTRDRQALRSRYLTDARLRLAYLAYFLPVNVGKVCMVLDELSQCDSSPEETGPLRVLDLGSGPGTGALALMDWIRRSSSRARPIEVTAVEAVGAALEEAEALWQEYCCMNHVENARLHRVHADLERHGWDRAIEPSAPYHVILMANTLNELYRASPNSVKRQVELVQVLLQRLHHHGALIIIEPALRQTARNLHRVRDHLLALQVCTVYSPCLHEQPCPALIREDDWCHEERPWLPPPWITAIDREVGFIKDALKFSYVVLRKDGAMIVPRNRDVFRVVSELRPMKGDTRAWLCNETGRFEVGRLHRDEADSNAPLSQWHRGAIVEISAIEKKHTAGVGRIRPETSVRMIRPV